MDSHLKLGGLMGATPYSNYSILDAAALQQRHRDLRHLNHFFQTPHHLQNMYLYPQDKPVTAQGNSTACAKFDIPDYVVQDLICRFIANVPDQEEYEPVRALFQVELAHWFFIDHYCGEEGDPKLLGMAHIPFTQFAHVMFEKAPHLKQFYPEVDKYIAEFRAYRNRVPTFGAILMNQQLTQVVLVQGFRNNWGFPKGKVNEGEDPVECAIREVMEETGYDSRPLINRNHYIESKTKDRNARLYIVRGVDTKFPFSPQTQYEIKRISWFNLDELPEHKKDTNPNIPKNGYPVSNFFTTYPYIKRLKAWVKDKLEGTNKINYFQSRYFASDKEEEENFMNINTTGGTAASAGQYQYQYDTTRQFLNPSNSNARSSTPGQEILRSIQGGHGLPNVPGSASSSQMQASQSQSSGMKVHQQQLKQNVAEKKGGKGSKSKKHLFADGPDTQNASNVISHLLERQRQSEMDRLSKSQSCNKPAYLDNFQLSAPSWENFKFDQDRIFKVFKGKKH